VYILVKETLENTPSGHCEQFTPLSDHQ